MTRVTKSVKSTLRGVAHCISDVIGGAVRKVKSRVPSLPTKRRLARKPSSPYFIPTDLDQLSPSDLQLLPHNISCDDPAVLCYRRFYLPCNWEIREPPDPEAAENDPVSASIVCIEAENHALSEPILPARECEEEKAAFDQMCTKFSKLSIKDINILTGGVPLYFPRPLRPAAIFGDHLVHDDYTPPERSVGPIQRHLVSQDFKYHSLVYVDSEIPIHLETPVPTDFAPTRPIDGGNALPIALPPPAATATGPRLIKPLPTRKKRPICNDVAPVIAASGRPIKHLPRRGQQQRTIGCAHVPTKPVQVIDGVFLDDVSSSVVSKSCDASVPSPTSAEITLTESPCVPLPQTKDAFQQLLELFPSQDSTQANVAFWSQLADACFDALEKHEMEPPKQNKIEDFDPIAMWDELIW